MKLIKLSQLAPSPFHDSGIFGVDHDVLEKTFTMIIETAEGDDFAPDTEAKMVFHGVEKIEATHPLEILNAWDTFGGISFVEAQDISGKELVKIYMTIADSSREHKTMTLSFSTTGFEWIPDEE